MIKKRAYMEKLSDIIRAVIAVLFMSIIISIVVIIWYKVLLDKGQGWFDPQIMETSKKIFIGCACSVVLMLLGIRWYEAGENKWIALAIMIGLSLCFLVAPGATFKDSQMVAIAKKVLLFVAGIGLVAIASRYYEIREKYHFTKKRLDLLETRIAEMRIMLPPEEDY